MEGNKNPAPEPKGKTGKLILFRIIADGTMSAAGTGIAREGLNKSSLCRPTRHSGESRNPGRPR